MKARVATTEGLRMTESEKRESARLFCQKWKNKGKEDEDDRSYWIDILERILGVENVTDLIEFQKKVIVDGNTKRIDAYIPETRVIIEQKTLGIALDKKGSQSGGIELTPYEQAKRYNDNLPYEEKARWIVTSNFAEIWIYDMNARIPEPQKLLLENIKDQFHRLDFLVNKKEATVTEEIRLSIEAGDHIAKIHDLFLKQYKDPNSAETLKSLNKLCVRLVFCMYAEDAGLFPGKNYFQKYTQKYTGGDYRKSIIEVFKILNIPEKDRDPYIEEDLNVFPYVNGGLFQDKNLEIPRIDEELKEALRKASEFDWSQISPTIFGAVFESTLNPETRRAGGMHYTSIENIHKVIDPLFLDDLKKEFEEIKAIAKASDKSKKLLEFQEKLSKLKFLDPACGSGNFLTETYVSLRRLENEIIRILHNGQMFLGIDDGKTNPIKVSINQFYGIEINDFAVTVAKTALWIAESQMMRETEDIVLNSLNFLPLKTNATIVEANALRIDWESVVPKSELNYIMGNPPFVGGMIMSKNQKSDMDFVFGKTKGVGELDYVCAWYKKASEYITNRYIAEDISDNNKVEENTDNYSPLVFSRKEKTKSQEDNNTYFVPTNCAVLSEDGLFIQSDGVIITSEGVFIEKDGIYKKVTKDTEEKKISIHKKIKVAFVSTNSICQGQQAVTLWKPLIENGINIYFAYKTFRWDSESSVKAHVHVIIVGFSKEKSDESYLFEGNQAKKVSNINSYLVEAPNIFVESRSKPLCDVPSMRFGSMPRDGGGFVLNAEERDYLLKNEPLSEKYIRPYIGSAEFINNKKRWCLWLVGASPKDIKQCPTLLKRIEAVREFRLNSVAAGTRKFAETPTLFCQIAQPDTEYIIVPQVSSERRRYVPIGFISSNVIASNLVNLIPSATLYHFGVLTSNVHMSWMRVVCGRLKSDYRYSKDIVYNNFPWPTPTPEQKAKIEATAQGILDARAKYHDCSLADLYDPVTIPIDLLKAHQANDKAVMEAYGLSVKGTSESDCVSYLMKLYQELVALEKRGKR